MRAHETAANHERILEAIAQCDLEGNTALIHEQVQRVRLYWSEVLDRSRHDRKRPDAAPRCLIAIKPDAIPTIGVIGCAATHCRATAMQRLALAHDHGAGGAASDGIRARVDRRRSRAFRQVHEGAGGARRAGEGYDGAAAQLGSRRAAWACVRRPVRRRPP